MRARARKQASGGGSAWRKRAADCGCARARFCAHVLLLGSGLQALLTLCASVFSLALAQDKNRAITKFKIRCSKYLYTLVIKDEVRTLRARDAPLRAWSSPARCGRRTRASVACAQARPSRSPLLTR
jgi:hypothetical protein